MTIVFNCRGIKVQSPKALTEYCELLESFKDMKDNENIEIDMKYTDSVIHQTIDYIFGYNPIGMKISKDSRIIDTLAYLGYKNLSQLMEKILKNLLFESKNMTDAIHKINNDIMRKKHSSDMLDSKYISCEVSFDVPEIKDYPEVLKKSISSKFMNEYILTIPHDKDFQLSLTHDSDKFILRADWIL